MRWLVLAAGLICGAVQAGDHVALEGHGGPIMDIAVSPSGLIASASFDNAIGLWREGAPQWLDGHGAAVTAIAFWSEERLVSGGDDFRLLFWDTGAAAPSTPRELGSHEGKITALAPIPSQGLLASASWDGTIGLWPLSATIDVADGPDPTQTAPRLLRGHDQGVNDLAVTADGTTLYSASADGTIRIWDVETGRERRSLVEHGFGINKLALNESAGWLAYGAVDGVTRIVTLADGAPLRDLSLERRPILALALAPSGETLAIGDGEGYIMTVETASWRILTDFHATARGPVWALSFSPGGEMILAGGLDPAVHGWPLDAMIPANRIAASAPSFLTDPDSMPNGERQFKRKCSICHTLEPGSARRAGPTLYGLFGRPVGSVADYSYSPALEQSDLVWSAKTIDALFEIGPEHYIPGTKMPMQRIAAANDRADLIDFLRDATAPRE